MFIVNFNCLANFFFSFLQPCFFTDDDTDEDPTYNINDDAEESQNNEGRPIAFKHLISKKYKLITYLSNQKFSKTNLTN